MDPLELLIEPCAEQGVQNFQQQAAGMLGGERVSGKKCEDA